MNLSLKTLTFLTVYIISDVGDTSAPKSCVSLMPYTLVTPHYPPICRPVLLLPTVLGRVLDKKLADWQGFQLCEPGERYCVVICWMKSCAFIFHICFRWSRCHLRDIFRYRGGTHFPVLTDKSVWLDRSHVCLLLQTRKEISSVNK